MPTSKTKMYGLVISGGKSTRMGCDKSLLIYHNKPQRYHAYELLATVCDKVFISCNTSQLAGINKDYTPLADLPAYKKVGPMAAILTAFTQYPANDLLVVGCDYPFVGQKDLAQFCYSLKPGAVAAAFYNYEQRAYEPMLAWYSSRSVPSLMRMHKEKNYSLQYFLEKNNAMKYYPADERTITSIDNQAAFIAARQLLRTNLKSR
jgi:molybdopterin-guanine dinucleotide biosynthesis protein A